MRTLEEVLNQFAYHPATPEVSEKYARMRSEVMELARVAWPLIPDGPEKTTAFRGLQQFLMHANLAIAMTTPADLANAHVARVLPPQAPSVAAAAINYSDLPDGATWRCSKCGTPLNDNASKNLVAGIDGYICDVCAQVH